VVVVASTIVLIEQTCSFGVTTNGLNKVTEEEWLALAREATPDHPPLDGSSVGATKVGGEEGSVLPAIGKHQELSSARRRSTVDAVNWRQALVQAGSDDGDGCF
jgi:hypothetical protein